MLCKMVARQQAESAHFVIERLVSGQYNKALNTGRLNKRLPTSAISANDSLLTNLRLGQRSFDSRPYLSILCQLRLF